VFTLFGFTVALAPAQLAGLALAAVGVLAAAHLVGRRRRRIVVSTVDPWSFAQGPARRTRLGWRIQRWLTFLLHVSIALLLLLALADPRPGPARPDARSIAILIDRSASMGASAGGSTRLERARARARAVVAAAEPGDRILVASFARQVEPETGWTRDAAVIDAAIERIALSAQADDPATAIAAAATLAPDRGDLKIVAIGDRPAADVAARLTRAPRGQAVEYLPVGVPIDNVGIVGFSLQRAEDEPSRGEAWLTVQASGGAGQVVRIDLVSLPSGRRIGGARLDLPARGARSAHVSFPAAGEGTVAALVREPAPGPGNALPADDRAVAPLPPPTKRRVLLVTEGNHYLEGALRSFGASLSVDRRAPSGQAPERLAQSGYDVVVFDGVAPLPAPASGRFLYLDPAGPGSPFPAGGQLRDPVPTALRRDHPLLRHVTLADLNIREARRLTAGPGDVVVAAALEVPLILTREAAGLRLVALAFDLRRSDLPLRPTLPLLLANALDWLAAGPGMTAGEPGAALIDPGEADTSQAADAPPVSDPPGGKPRRAPLPARPAHLLLLAALALALAEWWAHQRRWTS
jgi:hypothetical protein